MISETDGNRILFNYMIEIGIEKGIGSSYEVLGLRSDQDRDRSDRIELRVKQQRQLYLLFSVFWFLFPPGEREIDLMTSRRGYFPLSRVFIIPKKENRIRDRIRNRIRNRIE